MLSRIIELSLRHRGVVIALTMALLAWGVFVAMRVKLDVFPEFVQPQVDVQTEAPGLTPEQVEALITRPLESAISGVGQMQSIRSESIQGLSVITVVFAEDANPFTTRQMLAEKLGEAAGHLPQGADSPKMSPLTSSTMDLLKIGLTSKTRTPMELRSLADWVVRPRLLAVPGVARVTIFGGDVRELQVQVVPEWMIAHDVSLTDVLAAAKGATGVRGAGFVESATQRVLLQTDSGALTPEQLGNVVVATSKSGNPVRLRDVARVSYGAEPKFGDALIGGEPGVLLPMAGAYGANTLEVTRAAEAALEEMAPMFEKEGVTLHRALHRPANFIETALENVRHSLMIGGALVAIVLVFFLLDWRTALISFLAIPLSLLTAVIILNWRGVAIDTMTLGGFAVAIGVVVDDAIIDVENILRRLRQNAALAAPRPLFDVIVDASMEVRSAVVYATFIVAFVFLPVLTMSGLQGRFFAPLGVAFILATLASLAVALTVTPALCHLLFGGKTKPHSEPFWIRWMRSLHAAVLRPVCDAPWLALGVCLVFFCATAALLPFFGNQLLPDFREGHFVCQASMAPGTSLAEMRRFGKTLCEKIAADRRIATVEMQMGRAENGEDTWGPHRSELHVELKPLRAKEQEKVQEFLRGTLESFPGVQSEVLTFLGDRIGESIAGETAAVVVNIFGDDLDLLDAKGKEVAAALQSLSGAHDVGVKAPSGAPRFAIHLRNDRLTQFGFKPVEVLEAVETAFQGANVAQVYEGTKVFNLTVILDEAHRRDPEQVGSLLISNADGTRLPLSVLADIGMEAGRDTILHDGGRRRQTVTCNVEDRDVASFTDEARKKIAEKVALPAGVYFTITGAAEEEEHARNELLLHSLTAAAGILILLSLVFRRARLWLLVLCNLPFALAGGVIAAALAGGVLSIGSLVGFVTLFGITARNSIMLLSHYEHLVGKESADWNLETAVRGAGERLVPILMTALVTAFGLLPLALGSGEPGKEIEGPMAIVILGGLATSTLLNLLVMPSLALRFGGFTKPTAET